MSLGIRLAYSRHLRRLLALMANAGWAAAQWLTDAWGAFAACLPGEQPQVGADVIMERKFLTLRTRPKRLTV